MHKIEDFDFRECRYVEKRCGMYFCNKMWRYVENERCPCEHGEECAYDGDYYYDNEEEEMEAAFREAFY